MKQGVSCMHRTDIINCKKVTVTVKAKQKREDGRHKDWLLKITETDYSCSGQLPLRLEQDP